MEGIFSNRIKTLLESGKLGFWEEFFKAEMKKDYFASLENFLNSEYQNEVIFPKVEKIFSAFTSCDFEKLKVILIGQDPYHEENQAVGLAFSVPREQKIPPSLRNIFKELESDKGISRKSGDISDLARKGVFLINTVLTVRKGHANTHAKMGWEIFTKSAVGYLCEKNPNVVLVLFGKPAEKFEVLAKNRANVIKTAHPSPLSAYRGFFGSKIFTKIDEILSLNGDGIDWNEDVEENVEEMGQMSFLN